MEGIGSPVRLPEGFCFLVSRADGRPAQPAFDYLASAYLSGVRVRALKVAKNTIKAVVDDLVDFHHFLDANNLRVSDVSEEALEGYLGSMTQVCSPVTRRLYGRATVIRRRSSVTRFLKWVQEQGLLKHRFETEMVSTSRGSFERFAPNLPAPRPEPIDKLVRAIPPFVLAHLLAECGPALVSPGENGDLFFEKHPSTLRLMAEISLHCGLRRSEVCDLQLSDVERVRLASHGEFASIAVSVTGKGGRTRRVPFPIWILKSLKYYIDNVRAPLVGSENSPTKRHSKIFVLKTPRAGAKGAPVTPKMFNSKFAEARAAMLRRLRNEGSELYELAQYSRLTVHALRHTFALVTFISRRDQGDPCPAKYVQSVLGHRYQDTTERVYLRSSHVFESEIAQAMEQMSAGNEF